MSIPYGVLTLIILVGINIVSSAQKKAIERMDLSRVLHTQAVLCAARYSSDAFRKSVDSLVPRSYIRYQCERFNRIVKHLEEQTPIRTSENEDTLHIPKSMFFTFYQTLLAPAPVILCVEFAD